MSISEIAQDEDLPTTFLAKTFQKLARHGILEAHRGAGRGYALARPAVEISVRAVLEAIEGAELFRRCVFAGSRCSDDHPCLLHDHLKPAVAALRAAIEELTLAAFADGTAVPPAPTALARPEPWH
ncbi:MAG: Rrf2 family transcriptional regulator [Gemmatimonadales bacterium]|nr:Rrf2 family transcriptional regulator [Gemmatimonadales bacterium]